MRLAMYYIQAIFMIVIFNGVLHNLTWERIPLKNFKLIWGLTFASGMAINTICYNFKSMYTSNGMFLGIFLLIVLTYFVQANLRKIVLSVGLVVLTMLIEMVFEGVFGALYMMIYIHESMDFLVTSPMRIIALTATLIASFLLSGFLRKPVGKWIEKIGVIEIDRRRPSMMTSTVFLIFLNFMIITLLLLIYRVNVEQHFKISSNCMLKFQGNTKLLHDICVATR